MLSSSVRNVGFPGDGRRQYSSRSFGNEAEEPVDRRGGVLVSSALFLHANADRCWENSGKDRKTAEDADGSGEAGAAKPAPLFPLPFGSTLREAKTGGPSDGVEDGRNRGRR